MVDRDRIDHVFDNLIVNAIQHTPRGGSIRLAARPEGDSVRVEVRDTGRGIADEHLPRLFEKFYRIPGQSRAGGAGLGLAIVREVVAAHGGHVEVASQPGHGTTFTFTLPASHAVPEPAENEGALS
jgi:signal transduction histidine kinase